MSTSFDDQELLRQYAEAGSEPAFTELVTRYINLVYSTALRQLNNPDIARDVTQGVFTDLARKAGSLSGDVVLAGWLYQASRFAASKILRKEHRRQLREREAVAMHDPIPQANSNWEQCYPQLDTAIGDLKTIDRDAVLLRFFQKKDYRTVGATLGISEEAAKKRVSRALDRIRTLLNERGVTLSDSALLAAVTGVALQSAPTGLAASVINTSLAGATGLSGASFSVNISRL